MRKYVPLIEVCDFQGGSQPPKEQWIDHEKEGYVRMLQIRDFTQSDKNNIEYVIKTKTTKICNEDDILIARYGASVGKILTGLAGAYNVAIIKTIPDTSKLSKRFLYHYLNSSYFQNFILSVGSRAAQAGFNKEDLRDAHIPNLTLEEQNVIVEQLDKIIELLSVRRRQLSKLDELVKSRFIKMFIGKGYPFKTIDEVSLGKGEYGAQSASIEYEPSRPRYVRITDINDDGTLNDDMVASLNSCDDEQYRLEYGDFMFARMGATVGKTYAFIEGSQIFAGYLIRYKLNTDLINPRYLFYYTKLDEYWNWVKLNQSGAAQPGINAKKYGSLQIPLPPIQLQNEFASFVEQTEKLKLEVKESLEKLETLKKSLMQKYFG